MRNFLRRVAPSIAVGVGWLAGLTACGHGASTEKAPAGPGDPTTPTASSTASAAPIALPPRDNACATDAECGSTLLRAEAPNACCGGCIYTSGSKRWVEELGRTCSERRASLQCGMAPMCNPMQPPSKCTNGACAIVAR